MDSAAVCMLFFSDYPAELETVFKIKIFKILKKV